MNQPRNLPIVMLLMTTIACGPARIGSKSTDDETDSGEVGSDTSSSGTTTTTDSSDTDSSDTETSDTETTTEESTLTDFVPRTDDVWLFECDPWVQDCPEGEKCVPYASSGGSWDAYKCVPIMGEQAPGEPCTSGGIVEATDDCDANGACIIVEEVDDELVGVCWAYCTGTPDMPECPEGSQCALTGDGVLTFCIPSCDPLAQDCDPGLACYWTGSNFNCTSSAQDLPAGQPCRYINDCAAGLACAPAESLPDCAEPSCCTPFCNIELGDQQCDSVPGTSCVPFFEDGTAPSGYELVGVCTLP